MLADGLLAHAGATIDEDGISALMYRSFSSRVPNHSGQYNDRLSKS